MRPAALRLEDLHEPGTLLALVALPENELIERKRNADRATLAKVVSGFANAVGGWLLLGVDDDGTVSGWRPSGRAPPRDWLRDVLDSRLDPLPHFDAAAFDVAGVPIGIVRVPRSADAPHFMADSGEVYERRNGQTARASAARVRELYLRRGAGRQAARARIADRDAARDAAASLNAPPTAEAMDARDVASILRVSLDEVPESLRDWMHRPEARAASERFVEAAARSLNERGIDWFAVSEPANVRSTLGGHVAQIAWEGRLLQRIVAAWDDQGIGGVRMAGRRLDDSGIYYLLSDQVRDGWLKTALEYLLTTLERCHALGPVIVRWDLHGVSGADVMRTDTRSYVRAQGIIPAHYGDRVAVEVDLDVGAATAAEGADKLWVQLERLAGATST